MYFKTKKRVGQKFLARVTLIVSMFLIITLSFSSCMEISSKSYRSLVYNTHADFVEFIESYNSKNDGSICTFVSFNFDNNDNVKPYHYRLHTLWQYNTSLITDERTPAELYDKNSPNGSNFECEMIFHISDVSMYSISSNNEYQIMCQYETSDKSNYCQNIETSLDFIESYHIDDGEVYFEKMMAKYHSVSETWCEEFCEKFVDVRTLNGDTLDYERYFNYIYIYQITIGTEMIDVQVSSITKLSQEKLDEICKLLMDNIVIINAEDK